MTEGYWRPSYQYLRLRWHLDGQDAEDAVQAFFHDGVREALAVVRSRCPRAVGRVDGSPGAAGIMNSPTDIDTVLREVTALTR